MKLGRPMIDLSGSKFGRLTVLSYTGRRKNTTTWWNCLCECGTERVASSEGLKKGYTRFCGRLQCARPGDRSSRLRGKPASRHPLYPVWSCMMARCYRADNPSFPYYGGRGVRVCDEWHDPWRFFEAVGDRPANTTLDRIDNENGHYEPGNVRWVDHTTQMRNTRHNVLLEFNGKRMCMAEWAEELGIPVARIRSRLKYGWSVERTLTEPKNRSGDYQRKRQGTIAAGG